MNKFRSILAVVLSAALLWSSGVADAALAVSQPPPRQLQALLTPPSALGQVGESYSADGETGGRGDGETQRPLVILIQDLHAHYGVQKNIEGILEFLVQKLTPLDVSPRHPVSPSPRLPFAVAVEGAAGPIDSSVMALFPDKKVKLAAADYLMREGELTGAEYFAVMRGIPDLLTGVEDGRYYNLHRDLFRKTIEDRERLVSMLKGLQTDIRSLEPKTFSKDLKEFQRKLNAFENGEMSLGEAEAWLSKEAAAFGMDAGALSRGNRNRLYEDIAALAFILKIQKAQTPAEKDLIQVEHDLELLLKVADLQATESQVRSFGPRLNQFVALCHSLLKSSGLGEQDVAFDELKIRELISSSIDYYAMAMMRNKPMVENTLALISKHAGKQDVAVLVAGGFHTAPITQMLRERKISYVVITPAVDHLTEADHALYVKRLSGELLTEDEILAAGLNRTSTLAKAMHSKAAPVALSGGFDILSNKIRLTALFVISSISNSAAYASHVLQFKKDVAQYVYRLPDTAASDTLTWLKSSEGRKFVTPPEATAVTPPAKPAAGPKNLADQPDRRRLIEELLAQNPEDRLERLTDLYQKDGAQWQDLLNKVTTAIAYETGVLRDQRSQGRQTQANDAGRLTALQNLQAAIVQVSEAPRPPGMRSVKERLRRIDDKRPTPARGKPGVVGIVSALLLALALPALSSGQSLRTPNEPAGIEHRVEIPSSEAKARSYVQRMSLDFLRRELQLPDDSIVGLNHLGVDTPQLLLERFVDLALQDASLISDIGNFDLAKGIRLTEIMWNRRRAGAPEGAQAEEIIKTLRESILRRLDNPASIAVSWELPSIVRNISTATDPANHWSMFAFATDDIGRLIQAVETGYRTLQAERAQHLESTDAYKELSLSMGRQLGGIAAISDPAALPAFFALLHATKGDNLPAHIWASALQQSYQGRVETQPGKAFNQALRELLSAFNIADAQTLPYLKTMLTDLILTESEGSSIAYVADTDRGVVQSAIDQLFKLLLSEIDGKPSGGTGMSAVWNRRAVPDSIKVLLNAAEWTIAEPYQTELQSRLNDLEKRKYLVSVLGNLYPFLDIAQLKRTVSEIAEKEHNPGMMKELVPEPKKKIQEPYLAIRSDFRKRMIRPYEGSGQSDEETAPAAEPAAAPRGGSPLGAASIAFLSVLTATLLLAVLLLPMIVNINTPLSSQDALNHWTSLQTLLFGGVAGGASLLAVIPGAPGARPPHEWHIEVEKNVFRSWTDSGFWNTYVLTVKAAEAFTNEFLNKHSKESMADLLSRKTGKSIGPDDLSDDVAINFYKQGMHKYVFKVSFRTINGENVDVILVLKQEQARDDITLIELQDLEALSGLTPNTPRLVETFESDGKVLYLEEFIDGPTVRERRKQAKTREPKVQASVVEALLNIGHALGALPKDIHEMNFILREDAAGHMTAVMVDLGDRRTPLDVALLRLIAFYGNFGEQQAAGGNRFIFQTYLNVFGNEKGLELLRQNLAYIRQQTRWDQRRLKVPGETSPKKRELRDERNEPALTQEETHAVLQELEAFLNERRGQAGSGPAAAPSGSAMGKLTDDQGLIVQQARIDLTSRPGYAVLRGKNDKPVRDKYGRIIEGLKLKSGKPDKEQVDKVIRQIQAAADASVGLERIHINGIIKFLKDLNQRGDIRFLEQNPHGVHGFSDGRALLITEELLNDPLSSVIALFHEGGEGYFALHPAEGAKLKMSPHEYLRGAGRGDRLNKSSVREGLQDRLFGVQRNQALTEAIRSRPALKPMSAGNRARSDKLRIENFLDHFRADFSSDLEYLQAFKTGGKGSKKEKPGDLKQLEKEYEVANALAVVLGYASLGDLLRQVGVEGIAAPTTLEFPNSLELIKRVMSGVLKDRPSALKDFFAEDAGKTYPEELHAYADAWGEFFGYTGRKDSPRGRNFLADLDRYGAHHANSNPAREPIAFDPPLFKNSGYPPGARVPLRVLGTAEPVKAPTLEFRVTGSEGSARKDQVSTPILTEAAWVISGKLALKVWVSDGAIFVQRYHYSDEKITTLDPHPINLAKTLYEREEEVGDNFGFGHWYHYSDNTISTSQNGEPGDDRLAVAVLQPEGAKGPSGLGRFQLLVKVDTLNKKPVTVLGLPEQSVSQHTFINPLFAGEPLKSSKEELIEHQEKIAAARRQQSESREALIKEAFDTAVGEAPVKVQASLAEYKRRLGSRVDFLPVAREYVGELVAEMTALLKARGQEWDKSAEKMLTKFATTERANFLTSANEPRPYVLAEFKKQRETWITSGKKLEEWVKEFGHLQQIRYSSGKAQMERELPAALVKALVDIGKKEGDLKWLSGAEEGLDRLPPGPNPSATVQKFAKEFIEEKFPPIKKAENKRPDHESFLGNVLRGRFGKVSMYWRSRQEAQQAGTAGRLDRSLVYRARKLVRQPELAAFFAAEFFGNLKNNLRVLPLSQAPEFKETGKVPFNLLGMTVLAELDGQGKIRSMTIYVDERLEKNGQYHVLFHELIHNVHFMMKEKLSQERESNRLRRLQQWLAPRAYTEWRVLQAEELILKGVMAAMANDIQQSQAAVAISKKAGRARLRDLPSALMARLLARYADPRIVAEEKAFKNQLIGAAA